MTFCRPFLVLDAKKSPKKSWSFFCPSFWSATKKGQQKVVLAILDAKRSPWGKNGQKSWHLRSPLVKTVLKSKQRYLLNGSCDYFLVFTKRSSGGSSFWWTPWFMVEIFLEIIRHWLGVRSRRWSDMLFETIISRRHFLRIS